MRTNIFFVFFLIVNTQSSYLDDFRYAMHHVETGFEKLLGDVVNDMEETIHCTISAIEHVLIINNVLDKPSDFNRKCIGDVHQATSFNANVPEYRKQIEPRVFDKLPTFTKLGDNSYKNVVSHEVHTSIKKVNSTLNSILESKNRNRGEDYNIYDPLHHDTNRLAEVCNLFRRELEKISSNVRNEVEKINFDQESPEASLREEIYILHEVEKGSNSSQLSDMHHIVESALNVLKSNDNANSKNNEIENIIKELEKPDNNESQSLLDYEQRKKSNTISKENNYIITENEKSQNHESKSPDMFSSFLDSMSSASNDKDNTQDVVKIIEDSKIASMLFNQNFEGMNVFDNTGFFNF